LKSAKTFRKLDEIQNFSLSICFSQFGKKKAGTKCRSHEVEGSDLDYSGLIQINQDQTKTSRKPNKQTKNKKKNKDLATWQLVQRSE